MLAIAVDPRRKSLDLLDIEPPRITRPTQVLLRMLEVGVCGTDREICAFEYGTPPAGSPHLVIGHEALAVVDEVGAKVKRVRPGDIVVPMVRRPCPHDHCASCAAERQDFCFTGDFTERGIKEAHGFMTERVVEDERWLCPVPAALREVGVLVEPLTIAQKALAQVRSLQSRLPWGCSADNRSCRAALVLGAGPVGLLGAMALRAEGFETTVYSRAEGAGERREVVERIGATFLPAEETPPAELGDRLGTIDLVYEAMGASSVSFRVLESLGANGVFVFTGVPGRKAPVEIDTDLLMRNLVLKNQVVLGTVNADRSAFQAAVDDLGRFMGEWPEAVSSLLTGRRPPTEHRKLLLERGTGIKDVIAFSE